MEVEPVLEAYECLYPVWLLEEASTSWELDKPGLVLGAALRHGVLAEKVVPGLGGHSVLTRDRLASGKNCPNSESRSSWPRKRLATSVNTSSSDMPRKGRPFVLSCSFCQEMENELALEPGTPAMTFKHLTVEKGAQSVALPITQGAPCWATLFGEQYCGLVSQPCSTTQPGPWSQMGLVLGVWRGCG